MPGKAWRVKFTDGTETIIYADSKEKARQLARERTHKEPDHPSTTYRNPY